MWATINGRVVRRPRDGSRVLKPELWNLWWNLVNWRPDGTLKWKAKDHRLGRAVSVMLKVDTSKVVAPICVG
jgi:hypothetical protein